MNFERVCSEHPPNLRARRWLGCRRGLPAPVSCRLSAPFAAGGVDHHQHCSWAPKGGATANAAVSPMVTPRNGQRIARARACVFLLRSCFAVPNVCTCVWEGVGGVTSGPRRKKIFLALAPPPFCGEHACAAWCISVPRCLPRFAFRLWLFVRAKAAIPESNGSTSVCLCGNGLLGGRKKLCSMCQSHPPPSDALPGAPEGRVCETRSVLWRFCRHCVGQPTIWLAKQLFQSVGGRIAALRKSRIPRNVRIFYGIFRF